MLWLLSAALLSIPQTYVSGAALPPVNVYEPFIRQQIGTLLRDAESARFEFADARQVTCPGRHFRMRERWKGWAVSVRVNGRNAYGAYAGFTPYEVLIMSDGSQSGIEVYESRAYGYVGCRDEAWT